MEARHGGHHHSNAHAHAAYWFLAVSFGLMVMYSMGLYIHGKIRPRKRFHYYVPWWLLVIIWLVLCLGTFVHPQSDLKWIARRFGRISFAIAIFSQYLALKPALLPRTYVLPLTFIHKWTGRTAVLFAMLHGSIYYEAYRRMGLVQILYEKENLLGEAALIAYLIIGVSSLVIIRRRWYFMFYFLHYPLAWGSTILMIWHARPSANAMVEVSVGVFAIQIIWRLIFSKAVNVTVEQVTPTLDLVTIERRGLPANFEIGCHLRLGPRLYDPRAWLQASHPYTVASLDSDKDIKLILRRTRFQIQARVYNCWGPFHAPFDMRSFEKVVVIGGGAGVALIPPIVRASQSSVKVKSIWVTRSREEQTILERVGVSACDVYITRDQGPGYDDIVETPIDEERDLGNDTFELETLHDLGASDTHVIDDDGSDEDELEPEDEVLLPKITKESDTVAGIKLFNGRPSWSEAVGTFVGPTDTAENTCIVACGPSKLVRDLESWAADRGLSFFAEEFTM